MLKHNQTLNSGNSDLCLCLFVCLFLKSVGVFPCVLTIWLWVWLLGCAWRAEKQHKIAKRLAAHRGGVLGVLGGLWQRAGVVMGNSGQRGGFLSLQLVNIWEMLEKHCKNKWYFFRWYWNGNTSVSQSQWKSSLRIYNGFCPIAVVHVWCWRTQTQSWIRTVEEPKRVLKMEFQCSSHDQVSQSWKLPQYPSLCRWFLAVWSLCSPAVAEIPYFLRHFIDLERL